MGTFGIYWKKKGAGTGGWGIELEAWCLTGKRCENVRAAIEGRCEYEDSSELVSRLRLIKSDSDFCARYRRRAMRTSEGQATSRGLGPVSLSKSGCTTIEGTL